MMKRPIMNGGFCLCLCLILCLITQQVSAAAYRPGPGISNTAVKKQYDMQWFHISESCNLRAKGKDVDEECSADTDWEWEEIEDYIDLPATVWNGEGVTNGSTGMQQTWQMTSPTGESGVTITATIKDKPTDPHADANDPSNVNVTKQMYAYEALAFLNCTSSNSGSPSESVYETTGTSETETLSLTESEVWAKDDGDLKKIDAFGSATWVLRTNPTTATLGSNGQLAVTIGVDASGTVVGKVFDNDINDGENSVSVGLTGGTGVSAGISFSHTLADTSEATVGGGFAFSSDDLGDDTDDKLEMISGDDPDPWLDTYWDNQTLDFGYDPSDVTFRGAKNAESKAKGVMESQTKSKDNSNNSQGKTSSTGSVIYLIGVPTYEPGTAPGPEPGYND